jgi:hypothetical protein
MFNLIVTNCHPETGIPFGVISAQNVHWLHEEIIQNGESVDWREFLDETDRLIGTFLANADESAKDFFDDCIYDETAIANFQSEVDEIEDWDFLEDNILEELRDTLIEDACLEFQEEEYEYAKDGEHYSLSFLGGAPLIWVHQSPVLVPARQCSPCCPGAVDLNNPDEDGFLAYAPPAHWFDDGECPYTDLIVSTDDYLKEGQKNVA